MRKFLQRTIEYFGRKNKYRISYWKFAVKLSLFLVLLFVIPVDFKAQPCPEVGPTDIYPCPLNTVEFYEFDLSSGPEAFVSQEILGKQKVPCCGDELNDNAGCSIIEVTTHPQTVGIRIIISGANAQSGDIKFTNDPNNVCGGTQYSMNDFIGDGGELCLTGAGPFYIPVCKPGQNDYCVTIEGIAAESFGDQVVLLDDQVSCNYELNVTSTVVLENIVWTEIYGDLDYLDCGTPTLDCLNPTFTPPGDLDQVEDYEYQVCGEFVDENCGNTGILVCDTVNIQVIPQIIVDLDDVTVCEGDFPERVTAEIDPQEPTFSYTWYDAYDGPLGSGSIIRTGNQPFFDAPGPGQYSLYVLDNRMIFDCERSFTYNFNVIEQYQPVADIEIIFDECDLNVWFIASGSSDNTGTSNLEYEWDFGDGSSDNFEVGNYRYDDCGTYTIGLTVTDPDVVVDCDEDYTEIEITFDPDPPILTCPPTLSGQCDISEVPEYTVWDDFLNGGGIYSDNCPVDPSSFAFIDEDSDNQTCPETITRVYEIADGCGNTATCEQTILINDTTNPIIDPEANDIILECDAEEIDNQLQDWLDNHAGAAATDNCTDEADLVWTYFPANPVLSDECGETGSVEVTFFVTDECGNSSSTTATFTVEDNTPPSLTFCPLTSFSETVECEGSTINENVADQWHADNLQTLNNCLIDFCGTYVITDDYVFDDTPVGCGNEFNISVTYTITDDCGNFTSFVATIEFEDTSVPSITTPPFDLNLDCNDSTQDADIQSWLNMNGGATADDDCSEITWSHNYSGLDIICGSAGSVDVTFTATDDCGYFIQTVANITITDNTAPTVDCDPVSETLECDGPVANKAYADNWNAINIQTLIDCSSDECSDIRVESNYDYLNLTDGCGFTGDLVVTYSILDDCDNVTTRQATLSVVDNTAPEVTCDPLDDVFECEDDFNETFADFWNQTNITRLENCSNDLCGELTVTSDYDFSDFSDFCNSTITVTYFITDECDQVTTRQATLTIVDSTAPEFENTGNDENSECQGEIPADNTDYQDWILRFADVEVSDVCGDVSLSVIEGSWNSTDCVDQIQVEIIATDECGLTNTVIRTFTITDTRPPSFDNTGSDGSAECQGSDPALNTDYQAWITQFADVSVSDVCGNVSLSVNEGSWNSTDCVDEIQVEIIATDECGLTNTVIRTFTITDTTIPSIDDPGADGAAECQGSDPSANTDYQAWLANFAGVQSSDICGAITLSYVEGIWRLEDCVDEIQVEFISTDECGLTNSVFRTFTITDTTIPSIDDPGADDAAECQGSDPALNTDYQAWLANFAGVQSSDICGAITLSYVEGPWNSSDCVDEIQVEFISTDECGLTNSVFRTFTITDTRPPSFDNTGSDGSAECQGDDPALNTAYQTWLSQFASAVANDVCGDVILSVNEGSWNSTDCVDEIQVEIIATDECGLTNTVIRTFTITDTRPPSFDNTGSDGSAECQGSDPALNTDYQAWITQFADVSVSDVCGNVSLSVNEGSWNSTDCVDEIQVEIIATDECGLTNTVIRTFTITDTTIPSIDDPGTDGTAECQGSDPSANTDYQAWLANFAGVQSSDICGAITLSYVEGPWNSSDCVDEIQVEFISTDECGLTNSVFRTFTITDTTIPSIDDPGADDAAECQGSDPELNTDYQAWLANFAGVQSSDICGAITLSYVEGPWNSSDCVDEIQVEFISTDECGLTNSVFRTFTITDTRPPSFDNTGSDGSAECQGDDPALNTAYQTWLSQFASAVATDVCGDVILSVIEGSWNSTDCVDEIQVEIIATDECGLTNTVIRTFTITDTTIPSIDDPGADGTAECQGSDPEVNTDYQAWLANFAGVQSSDICGEITLSYVEGPWNSSDCVDEIQVEFISTDECGLTNSVFRTFTITDTTIPSIDDPGADDAAECQGSDPALNTDYQAWLANFAGVQSSDICGEITLSYVEGPWNSSDCVDEIQVEFISTDECGLTNSVFRTFTITDTTIPSIDDPGADGAAECQGSDPSANSDYQAWLANFAGVQSSDICGEITLSYIEGPWNSSDCVDEIQVEFISTDECGLTNSVFRTFTITDTRPPSFDNTGSDGSAECQGDDPALNTAYQTWLSQFASAVATDVCGDVILSVNEGSWNSTDCVDEIQVEIIATDECGLTNTVIRTFTITDTTIPSIDDPGTDGTAECQGSDPSANTDYQAWLANFAGVQSSDICGAITLSYVEGPWNSSDCVDEIQVEFISTDECGLTNSVFRTFTITDTTIPAIDDPGADGTAECQGSDPSANTDYQAWLANFAGVQSSDICGEITLSYIEGIWRLEDCVDEIQVEFISTDECGLTNSVFRTFTITDTTIPSIDDPGADGTAECQGSDPAVNTDYQAWLANFAGVQSSDICGEITLSYIEGPWNSSDCVDEIQVEFISTDECGLTNSVFRTFTITDTRPPSFDNTGSDGSAECQGDDPALNTAYQTWLSQFASAVATDVCGDVILSVNEGSWNSTDCVDEIQVEIIATDECGLTNTVIRTFTITDTTIPSIDDPGTDGTAECQGSDPSANTDYQAWLANFAGVQSSDICGAITLSYVEGPWNSSDCVDEIQVEFISTDECGLTNSVYRTFTITDTTIPAIDDPGADGTAECQGSDPSANTDYQAWLANFAGVQSSDICGEITLSYIEGPWNSSDCVDEIQVEYISTDECGLTNSVFRTFTITDTTIPSIDDPGADGTAECQGSDPAVNTDYQAWLANFAGVQSSDICGEITLSYVEGPWNSSDCVDEIQVEFISTDECGLTNSVFRTFTITDTTIPSIDDLGADGTAECQGSDPAVNTDYQAWLANFAGVQSSDICGAITLSYVEGPWNSSDCVDEIQVEFISTDECGLTNSVFRTFTITDTTPPTIDSEGADGTAECQGSDPAVNTDYQAWLANFAGVQSSDICGEITLSYVEGPWNSSDCVDEIQVEFISTDECGLTNSVFRTFTITDTTIPSIDDEGADGTAECQGSDPSANTDYQAWLANFAGVQSSDICGEITLSYIEGPWNSSDCVDEIQVEFISTDECGLTNSVFRTFTITDTTIPSIDDPGVDGTAECQGSDPAVNTDYQAWLANFAGVNSSDICGEITLSYVEGPWNSSDCVDEIQVEFISTDECGLTNSVFRTFTITDTTIPSIDDPGADGTAECQGSDPSANSDYQAWLANFAGVQSSDICGAITLSYVEGPWNSSDCVDEIQVEFISTDECGLTNSVFRTFTITDTTIPSIDDPGADSAAECQGSDPSANTDYQAWLANFAGVQSSDICGEITLSYVEGPWNSSDCVDEIQVEFISTDECGLTNSVFRIFTITDTTPPTIDNEGADGTAECQGSDPAVNTDYQAWLANFAGVNSSDICGEITLSYVEGSWNSSDCVDEIQVEFISTDECGLTNSVFRIFTITDTTPPTIDNEGADGTAECQGNDPSANTDYQAWLANFAGVQSSDICGEITLSYIEGPWNSSDCVDEIQVEFISTDECGLTNSVFRTFTITDTTIPSIDDPGADGAAECQGSDPSANSDYQAWLANFAGVQSSDICGEITLSYIEGPWNSSDCVDEIQVEFISTDECGLTNSVFRIFTITDTTPPTIDDEGADGTAECQGSDPAVNTDYQAWLANFAGVQSSDICGAISLSYVEGPWNSSDCVDEIQVEFISTDECGLTNSVFRIFTITDTTPPTIDSEGADGTAECQGSDPSANTDYQAWLANFAGVQSSDICGEITLSYVEGPWNSSDCVDEIQVEFISTDECGLTNSVFRTFTITDTTIPSIDDPGADGTAECQGSDPAVNTDYQAWLANFAGVQSSDICGAITLSYVEGPWNSSDCVDEIQVEFISTDECGLTNSVFRIFTITDTTPPTIDNEGADGTAECQGSDPSANTDYQAWLANFAGVQSSDICGEITLSYIEGIWRLEDCVDEIQVEFISTDECGLTNSVFRTFTITDTTIPSIDDPGADGTAECQGSDPSANSDYQAWLANFAGVQSSDICGEITLSYVEGPWNSSDCVDEIQVEFISTDECGLTNSVFRTFTITDTTIPSIDDPGADGTAECQGSDPAVNTDYQAWLANFAGVQSSDICGAITLSYIEGPWNSSDCVDEIQVEFISTDECGLTNAVFRIFTITDTTPPTIDNEGADGTAECQGSDPAVNTDYQAWLANFAGVQSSDICGEITLSYIEGPWNSSDCVDEIQVEFISTDECGLTNSVFRTFTITDTTIPSIDDPGADGTAECQGSDPSANTDYQAWLANFAGVQSSDICGEITLSYVEGPWNSSDCVDEIQVEFISTDECGLTNSVFRIFTITDTTPPTIDNEGADGTAECQGSDPAVNTDYQAWLANFAGVQPSDICGEITLSYVEGPWNSSDCVDEIQVEFISTDECGLTNSVFRTFTITDTTIPSIDDEGADGTAECQGSDPSANTDYQAWLANFAGVQSSDICGEITLSYIEGPWNSSDCVDEIQVEFISTDECGLTNSVFRIFTITDTTPPTIDDEGADGTAECQGSDPAVNTDYQAWLANFAGVQSSDI
ncbi:PKD domain-containing protein, partial [Portibacter marinus]|uniref:PKD domain-containing protein n=1 Tax=Portibacter marinus TaxID=2898660 RepID=UPI001F47CDF2